jgi:hypothetical protein
MIDAFNHGVKIQVFRGVWEGFVHGMYQKSFTVAVILGIETGEFTGEVVKPLYICTLFEKP